MTVTFCEGFFPFCIKEAEEWDGETYYGFRPSGSNTSYIPVVGQGTPYPIAMSLEEVSALYWRTRVARLQVDQIAVTTIAPQTVTGVSFAALPENFTSAQWNQLVFYPDGDTANPVENQEEFFLDEGFLPPSSYLKLVCKSAKTGVVSFRTEYAPASALLGVPSKTDFPDVEWFEIDVASPLFANWGEATGAFSASLVVCSEGYQEPAVLIKGSEYYPRILVGFYFGSPDGVSESGIVEISSQKLFGKSEKFYGPAGSVQFAPDSLLSGKQINLFYSWSYSDGTEEEPPPTPSVSNAVLSFPKWWTYGGIYDETTGERV